MAAPVAKSVGAGQRLEAKRIDQSTSVQLETPIPGLSMQVPLSTHTAYRGWVGLFRRR